MVARIATAVLTLAGVLALLLGLLIWSGVAVNMISMHMLLGLLAVGALWVVGIAQAAAAGGSWTLAGAAVMVGALTAVFGWYQSSLLLGDFHWVAQVIHLFLGIATIGLGHVAAARDRRAASRR